MAFDDLASAINDAEITIRRGDNVARKLARLLRGRLKVADIDPSTLEELKRELRDFNIHTGRWMR